MASEHSVEQDIPPSVDKGKGKGPGYSEEPSERTPLLTQSSSLSPSYDDEVPLSVGTRRRPRSILCRLLLVFFTALITTLVLVVIVGLIIYSRAYRSSNLSPDFLINHAIVLRGPDHVDVLNITDTGDLWVKVRGRVGVDAGAVVQAHSKEDDSLFSGLCKSITRWGIHRLGVVSVNLDTIYVYSDYGSKRILLSTLNSPPLEIPLTADPPEDLFWLKSMEATFLVSPTNDTSMLVQFVRDAWEHGIVAIKADVSKLSVTGGSLHENGWKNRVHADRSEVETKIRFQIPHIPGLPNPDRNSHFPHVSDLVTLQSFQVSSSEDSDEPLKVEAKATAINPAPESFKLNTPPLPFTIALPIPSSSIYDDKHAVIDVATVHTLPFSMTHPNLTLRITGNVLPLPSIPDASDALSSLLTNYLSGQPSPILISTPMIPDLFLETDFPAPSARPQILRNVTIRDMKVKPVGSKLYASGTVFARIVLPKGMNVGLQVNRVLPDVLVFDGPVPEGTEPPHPTSPTPAPLPDPLPERAFGHIRPDDWLDALSVSDDFPEDGPGDGAAYAVSAKIVDVPVEVLPGRQKEFSNFVGKVIFGSGGAIAGILGTADVAVDIRGLRDQDTYLGGLPFRGTVRVGKWTGP